MLEGIGCVARLRLSPVGRPGAARRVAMLSVNRSAGGGTVGNLPPAPGTWPGQRR